MPIVIDYDKPGDDDAPTFDVVQDQLLAQLGTQLEDCTVPLCLRLNANNEYPRVSRTVLTTFAASPQRGRLRDLSVHEDEDIVRGLCDSFNPMGVARFDGLTRLVWQARRTEMPNRLLGFLLSALPRLVELTLDTWLPTPINKEMQRKEDERAQREWPHLRQQRIARNKADVEGLQRLEDELAAAATPLSSSLHESIVRLVSSLGDDDDFLHRWTCPALEFFACTSPDVTAAAVAGFVSRCPRLRVVAPPPS
jgi:hypothetical protein